MIRVNLLKAEAKTVDEHPLPEAGEPVEKAKKKVPKPPQGTLLIGLIIVAAAAMAYFQKRSLDEERALLDRAQQEQRQLQPVTDRLEQLKWQRTYLEKKVNLITDLRSMQGLAVRILNEISLQLPDLVWLTEMGLKANGLSIKGRAQSNFLVSEFSKNLETCGTFSVVRIVSTQQRTEGINPFVEFGINANIPPPARPVEAAAPVQTKKKAPR